MSYEVGKVIKFIKLGTSDSIYLLLYKLSHFIHFTDLLLFFCGQFFFRIEILHKNELLPE